MLIRLMAAIVAFTGLTGCPEDDPCRGGMTEQCREQKQRAKNNLDRLLREFNAESGPVAGKECK